MSTHLPDESNSLVSRREEDCGESSQVSGLLSSTVGGLAPSSGGWNNEDGKKCH